MQAKSSFRGTALVGLAACCMLLPNTVPAAITPEKWDDAFGQLRTSGGCKWESDQPLNCATTPKEFEQVVKNVLTAPDLKIPIMNDPEFNNKGTPRVLVGIRCVPLHYRITEGGAFGVGGQEVYEVTQFYIQLLEPQSGILQFRVLRRSAEHLPGNLTLQPLNQPPNGRRIAQRIKDRLDAALSNLRSPP
jgi:hypothetical protein